MRFFVTAGALSLLATNVAAQCRPPRASNEAKLLAFYSAPMAFATTGVSRGTVRLTVGGELIPLPDPAPALRRTGECFTQKSENTDLSPIFARPRLLVGLGRGLSVEASYLPPITIADAEPHLASLAIAWTRRIATTTFGGEPRFMLRAHVTGGRVRGPITCPASALQQTSPGSPCYGERPSKDSFEPWTSGVEAVAGWGTGLSRLAAYAGLGANALRPRFRVNFTDAAGNVDRTRVEVNLQRLALFSGVTLRVSDTIDGGLQVYSVPADVTLIRLSAGYRLR